MFTIIELMYKIGFFICVNLLGKAKVFLFMGQDKNNQHKTIKRVCFTGLWGWHWFVGKKLTLYF